MSTQTEAAQQPDSWSRTNQQIVKFTHRWDIENFSFYLKSGDHEDLLLIDSPLFSPPNDQTLQFCFELFPKGNTKSSKGHVSIFLYMYACPKPEAKVHCNVSIIDRENIKHNTVFMMKKFKTNEPNSGRGMSKYITHKELIGLLTNDKLTIFCEIEALIDTIHTTIDTRCELSTRIEAQVLDNLGELFESRKMSDVVLVAGDSVKTEHRAHRTILAARSPVFAVMFEHDTTERNEGRVLIEDIDGEVIEEMLRYIYTGKVPKLDELADQLLEAADKYALDLLKSLCEQSIIANLNCDSVINMLLLADRHSAKQLRSKAIEFINANQSTIMKSDHWKAIEEQPKLYFGLFSNMLAENIKK